MSELDDATGRFAEGTETYDDRLVILGMLRRAQRERDEARRPYPVGTPQRRNVVDL